MDLITPPGVTRFILVRHAEPAEPPAGVRPGAADPGLSRHGLGQAEELGRWLRAAPIDRIVSSPRACARETAAPLARALGLEVAELAALDGTGWDEGWLQQPPPDARDLEPFAQVRERVRAAVVALGADPPRRTIAVVSHAVVNRIVLADALHLADADALGLDQSFCAVNVVDLADGASRVRLVNAVP
jgi:2,3-bisphosphoglycerate-dependent phosphoglycerate mutase